MFNNFYYFFFYFFFFFYYLSSVCFFFFFQAEDGIRDPLVTGVHTCALPIWAAAARWRSATGRRIDFESSTESSSEIIDPTATAMKTVAEMPPPFEVSAAT